MSALRLCGALFVAWLAGASGNGTAAITVGAGSSVNFGNAILDLACSDLVIGGQVNASAATITGIANLAVAGGGVFAPGASQIALGGNFVDAGAFAAGTSRISIVDACGTGTSQVSGTTSFYDLAVTSANGKQLVLPVGQAQSVTHSFTLQGVAGNPLRVASTAAGQQAILIVAAGAEQTISYVNVRDNNAGAGAPVAPGPAASYNSIDSGNLINWFASALTVASAPAPALSLWAQLLLGLGVFALARLPRRKTRFQNASAMRTS